MKNQRVEDYKSAIEEFYEQHNGKIQVFLILITIIISTFAGMTFNEIEPIIVTLLTLACVELLSLSLKDSIQQRKLNRILRKDEIKDGKFTSYVLTPEQFGYKRCQKEELQGGTPQENAAITRAILEGQETGAKRQAVCLNAGAALYIAGKADDLASGVKLAEELIDSGAALKKLEEFIEMSNME